MTAKVILAGFSLGLALLFGIQQLRSNQEKKERMRRGRVPVAVEDAQSKNQREVSLPASFPYYASVKDLDDALANYTTVIAKPVLGHSQMNAESKEIETWYKLEIIDFLSQPKNGKCPDCSFAKDVPSELQPIQANEIVVVKNTGSITLEGIKVTTSDQAFPDFTMNQKYLLFLSLDSATRVGSVELGPAGVSAIEPDGQIAPVSEKSNTLTKQLEERYGNVDEVKRQLRFRRFPQ